MKSLQEYTINQSTNNIDLAVLLEKFGTLANDLPINESQFIIENGKSLDTIFNKMHAYQRNISSNIINESYKSSFDIQLNINEQKAASDFLMYLGQSYAVSLLLENGIITEEMITEWSLTQTLSNAASFVKDTVKKGVAKAREGYETIKKKLKPLWDFLVKIAKEGIKSIKKLILSIVDLMLAFACKVDDLMEKLKADKKQALAELMAKIKTLFKHNKDEIKQNVFDSLANQLTDSSSIITEEMLINCKSATNEDYNNAIQAINEEENDKESDVNEIPDNEYDKAAKANPEIAPDVEGKSWGGILGKALMLVLIQALAYTVVCVVIPAIVTMIGGPLAGAIAENLAKIIWGSGVIFHQIRAEFKLHESGEYDRKYDTKWKKAFHWIFFLFNLAWAAWKLIGAGMAMNKIIGAWVDGNQKFLSTVLPSEAVQNCTGWLNSAWKLLSGKDAPGFTEMQNTIDKLQQGIYEKIGEHSEKVGEVHKHQGMSAEEAKEKFEKTNWNKSSAAVNTINKSAMSADAVNKLKDTTNVSVSMDGVVSMSNTWTKNAVNALKAGGYTEDQALKLLKGAATNKHLHNMCANAGSMNFVEMPAKAAKLLVKCTSANGVPIAVLGTDIHQTIIKHTTRFLVQHTPALQNTFDWFGGFIDLPTFADAKNTGNWFLLRMSSGKKGSQAIYDIQDIKEFTWKEAKSKFASLNQPVFNNMDNLITQNEGKLETMEKQVSNSDAGDEKNKEIGSKKSVKDVLKDKKKAADITGKSKNCFVLYGKRYKNDNKSQNESLLDELYDELLFESKVDTKQRDIIKVLLFILGKLLEELHNKSQDKDNEKKKKEIEDAVEKIQNVFHKELCDYISKSTETINKWNSPSDIKLTDKAKNKKTSIIKQICNVGNTEIIDTWNNLTYPQLPHISEIERKCWQVLPKDHGKQIDPGFLLGNDWQKILHKIQSDDDTLPQLKQIINWLGDHNLPNGEGGNDNSENGDGKNNASVNGDGENGDGKNNASVNGDGGNGDGGNKKDENDDDLVPVVIFNPLVMGVGDLLAGRSKSDKNEGKRSNVIYYKGMFSSFEILPKDGGFSREEIRKWLISVLQNSFKICMNASSNPPCYKTLMGAGKWKISDSFADNPNENIKEFGDFNANECLSIAKGDDDIEKYFGGLSKTTHNTVEKTDSPKHKEEHDKHVAEITQNLKSNEKVKKILDKYPDLKKKLIDDDGNVNADNVNAIADTVTRVDNNLGKKKKGLLSKIGNSLKSLFGKDDKDKLKDYDPKELQELSFALHSANVDNRKKRKKKQADESFDDNNDGMLNEIYEQIQDYIFTEELYEYLINNKINETKEITPKYGLLTAYVKSQIN